MKTMIRGMVAGVLLIALGLVLRWVTAGTLERLSADDFGSLAGLVAATVAWAAYAWLALAVVVTVLERLPGALGSASSVIAGGITSEGSRILLRSALGVAVVAPLTVGAAHAAPADSPNSVHWAAVEKPSSVPLTDVHRRSSVWDPRSGTEPGSSVPRHRPARPSVANRHLDQRPDQRPGRLAVPDRPTVGGETRYAPDRPSVPARPVVVRRGDSLWALAARELGPDASDQTIARRWPRWYAANAAVIGSDPDLIQPGQHLRPPGQHPSTPNQEN